MTLLVIAAMAAWILAWVVGAVSVTRRGDLGAGGKALWLVVLLVLPFLGLLVYYLWQAANPDRSRTRSRLTRLGGEGGIRTLEAGISPPNALAGRRLQPLGHFSADAIRISDSPARTCEPQPARGRGYPMPTRRGAGAAERGGLENR